jgi:uncharacterized protein (TIGR02594 family)
MTYEEWVQSRVSAHGFPVTIDGIWDRPDIEALKAFQKLRGLPQTGVTDPATVTALKASPDAPGTIVPPPAEAMPPWMAEMHRKMGLHEVRDNAVLSAWLKIGRALGNPASLPWCGDAVESCIAKTLPSEPLPANPFFAQSWASWGTDTIVPIVGAIGPIRWTASSGHVGIVAGIEGSTVYLLGGNQSNAINVSGFPRSKFIGFRWPKTYPRKAYPPLKGKATGILTQTSTR